MTVAEAEHAAMLARQALTRMEDSWALVKELGGAMPEEWWAAFGKACVSVRLAERDVSKAREAEAKRDSERA